MQKVIKAIKDCVTSKTCCEETGVDCNQGRKCPVREGTHKPAEAVHQIQEPTVNHQLTIEREAFESNELSNGRVVCLNGIGGRYTDKGQQDRWEGWRARAALAATPPTSAVTDGWTPTIENVNALPDPLRSYIHALETNADPSGMVRDNTILREQLSGLQVMFRKSQDALAATNAAAAPVKGRDDAES